MKDTPELNDKKADRNYFNLFITLTYRLILIIESKKSDYGQSN